MQPSSVVTPKYLSLSYEDQTSQHISKRMVTATETFSEETFYNHKPGKKSKFPPLSWQKQR